LHVVVLDKEAWGSVMAGRDVAVRGVRGRALRAASGFGAVKALVTLHDHQGSRDTEALDGGTGQECISMSNRIPSVDLAADRTSKSTCGVRE